MPRRKNQEPVTTSENTPDVPEDQEDQEEKLPLYVRVTEGAGKGRILGYNEDLLRSSREQVEVVYKDGDEYLNEREYGEKHGEEAVPDELREQHRINLVEPGNAGNPASPAHSEHPEHVQGAQVGGGYNPQRGPYDPRQGVYEPPVEDREETRRREEEEEQNQQEDYEEPEEVEEDEAREGDEQPQ